MASFNGPKELLRFVLGKPAQRHKTIKLFLPKVGIFTAPQGQEGTENFSSSVSGPECFTPGPEWVGSVPVSPSREQELTKSEADCFVFRSLQITTMFFSSFLDQTEAIERFSHFITFPPFKQLYRFPAKPCLFQVSLEFLHPLFPCHDLESRVLRFFFLECVPGCPCHSQMGGPWHRTQCLREDQTKTVAYLVLHGLLLLGALNLEFYPILQMMGKPRYFILESL